MARFTLTERVDLGVFYDADAPRYRGKNEHVLKIITREVFIRHYQGCQSIGFSFDGKPIGGIIYDGKGAHIAVLPEYHGRWAVLLRPALQWLFGIEPEILVKVEVENTVCVEFMRRNGWPALGTAHGWTTYRMTQHPRRHGLSVSRSTA